MNFFKKEDPKEQAKQSQREMRKVNRDLGTDLRQLERKEKELELEIKKLAKAGQKEACAVLAKQLVQLRKAKAKNMGMAANVTSVGAKTRAMSSMNTMANAMGSSTQAMKAVDKAMPMEKFAQTMREFDQANTRMDMRSEIIDETLDSMLEVDEAEEDMIIDQVLDEIGIETKAQLDRVPRVGGKLRSEPAKDSVDIEKLLAQLKE
ncbi:Protein C01A2.4 [Aphelenchoides avenae]|nr:Protein C01A2.4 [Aphelenchus avenae]